MSLYNLEDDEQEVFSTFKIVKSLTSKEVDDVKTLLSLWANDTSLPLEEAKLLLEEYLDATDFTSVVWAFQKKFNTISFVRFRACNKCLKNTIRDAVLLNSNVTTNKLLSPKELAKIEIGRDSMMATLFQELADYEKSIFHSRRALNTAEKYQHYDEIIALAFLTLETADAGHLEIDAAKLHSKIRASEKCLQLIKRFSESYAHIVGIANKRADSSATRLMDQTKVKLIKIELLELEQHVELTGASLLLYLKLLFELRMFQLEGKTAKYNQTERQILQLVQTNLALVTMTFCENVFGELGRSPKSSVGIFTDAIIS